MVTTPASRSALPQPRGMPTHTPVNPLCRRELLGGQQHYNSSNNALASCKSAVSNPSVNQA